MWGIVKNRRKKKTLGRKFAENLDFVEIKI